MMDIIGCASSDILRVSAKTGLGVKELLDAVIDYLPAPREVRSPASSSDL
jgi:GTP-binding protein LepA